MATSNPLRRSRRHRMIAGVCGGIAAWLGWDPTAVRILYVLVSILSAAFPPVPGEVLVRVMESEGYLLSTGAACSSRKIERTRVLESSGVPRELAACSVRISIGPQTTEAEVEGLLSALRRRLPGL